MWKLQLTVEVRPDGRPRAAGHPQVAHRITPIGFIILGLETVAALITIVGVFRM